MERRMSSRAQVDVPICALVDGFRHAGRAFDLSPTGMVFERSRSFAERHVTQASAFELYLPGERRIRARARPVWGKDRVMAVKFVMMHDVDRLTIAELLDRKALLREPLH